MELVTILRELWRLRAVVLVVALLAVLVGLAVAVRLPSMESRSYEVGVATARILVDTPNSAVVEVAPKGSDLLGVRANLIGNLMADGAVKDSIAERAGISPKLLRGVAESSPPPAGKAAVKIPPDKDYVISTRVLAAPDGERLPIIEVNVQAPNAVQAGKLAEASVTGLRDYLDSKAATEEVEDAQRLRVSGLGSPQAQSVVKGDRRLLAIVGGLFLFLVGCGAIVAISALARSWRLAAAWDSDDDELPPAADGPADDFMAFDELFEDDDRFGPLPETRHRITTPPDDEDESRRESA